MIASENDKNLSAWHIVENQLSRRHRKPNLRTGAVYWASLGINVGSEQNGKGPEFTRPVLIIHKYGDRIVPVAPITPGKRYGSYNYQILVSGKLESLLLNQIRTIDTLRIGNFIDEIPPGQLKRIKQKLFNLILE